MMDGWNDTVGDFGGSLVLVQDIRVLGSIISNHLVGSNCLPPERVNGSFCIK